ncbi:MAG: homoserine dehydrogenase [Ruminococcus sp.]|nr:homoserine dehydrogenase [Ruminococcus sp.]
MVKKIAVLGYGVVGSGVVELFYKNKKKIEANTHTELDVKYILDLREFPDDPYADKVVHDIQVIIDDPEVCYVAECMGGVNPAFQFVNACLEAGKSVATSNKQLVAEKGDILLAAAKKNNCNFFFEASVGGAIPIIRPLHTCLAANDISEIAGILNGTTNFILEKMFCDKMDFADALSLAQELGYAERNPSADVDGADACRKICILSSLAFGKHVYPESVYTKGIREIAKEDVQLAQELGGAVKLIGAVKRLDDGRILPTVMPMVVLNDSLISHVNGVFNAVMVWGDGVDKTMFYGRGAGKLPTASAVLGDIIDAVKSNGTVDSQSWEAVEDNSFVAGMDEFKAPRMYRLENISEDSVIKTAESVGISVISQTNSGCLVSSCDEDKAKEFADKLESIGIIVKAQIPVLEDN